MKSAVYMLGLALSLLTIPLMFYVLNQEMIAKNTKYVFEFREARVILIKELDNAYQDMRESLIKDHNTAIARDKFEGCVNKLRVLRLAENRGE